MNHGYEAPGVARDYAAEAAEAADNSTRTFQTTFGLGNNLSVGKYVWLHQDGSTTIETDVDKIFREQLPGEQVYQLGPEVKITIAVNPVKPAPHVTHRGIQGNMG